MEGGRIQTETNPDASTLSQNVAQLQVPIRVMKIQLFFQLLLLHQLEVSDSPPVRTPLAGPVLASLTLLQDRQQDFPASNLTFQVVGHHIVTNSHKDRGRHLKVIKIRSSESQ